MSKKSLQFLRKFFSVAAFITFLSSALVASSVSWFPLGPYGGDARSFAADSHDPSHLYLGTATGWIYESHDAGNSWKRVSQIAGMSDLVIDHILADPANPKRLFVAGWTIGRPDGGLWISNDAGADWYPQAEMHGQSVFSLARSPSSANELVAGTLRGVYRSLDDGLHWKQISPQGSTEIHEVQSIAIDPNDPNIIYAGTWHLPWKTLDGGEHWFSIKQGIIDDSDVFSILIDPVDSKVVYASACSGIYKSVNAGELFKGGVTLNKLQGLPSTARRTRKLEQDPKHLDTVYAGTTEGLYRSLNGGEQWTRLTNSDVIVNDVWVDPSNPDRVLIATDRGGVLSSDNAGLSFHPSNAGFSSRQVSAYAADPERPSTLYVGVVNDKATGGVFVSNDGGLRWEQKSDGLNGRDVFSLIATPGGNLLAGTEHGIYRLQSGVWLPAGTQMEAPHPAVEKTLPAHRRAPAHPSEAAAQPIPARAIDAQIFAFASVNNAIYAASSEGLLRSSVAGNQWKPVPTLDLAQPHFLAAYQSVLLAADFKHLAFSQDNARTWQRLPLPPGLTQIGAISVDNLSNLWVGGAEGVFLSSDNGANWQRVPDLSVTQVDSIYFDTANQRLLITTANSTFVFAVNLPDYKVSYWAAGWKLRFARPVGDHLVAATLYDGIVIQPIMVDSSFNSGSSAVKNPQQARTDRP